MRTYKSLLQITRSGNLRGTKTIVTVKFRGLHSVRNFNFAASFHSVDPAFVWAYTFRSVIKVTRVCNIY